jgi:mRNA-degrading endonuclease RelE of RelBE toxin-antitoxin system
MIRAFVSTRTFDRSWISLGLGDEEQRLLEKTLLLDPATGDVINGMSGARKIRFAVNNRGKRGGIRIIYVDIVVKEKIFLLHAYDKTKRTDLSPEGKRILARLVNELKGI